jgi:glycine cleavage system H lipoate-binding protein
MMRLIKNQSLLTADPYGSGWMIKVEVSDTAEYDGLLDAEPIAPLSLPK